MTNEMIYSRHQSKNIKTPFTPTMQLILVAIIFTQKHNSLLFLWFTKPHRHCPVRSIMNSFIIAHFMNWNREVIDLYHIRKAPPKMPSYVGNLCLKKTKQKTKTKTLNCSKSNFPVDNFLKPVDKFFLKINYFTIT